MNAALKENGIICCQGENLWVLGDLVKNIVSFTRKIYPSVGYAYTQIPTYPCGCIGFVLCSKEKVKKKKFTKIDNFQILFLN
jgi:spermidine synthase